MTANEAAIRRAYQVAEEKDVAGWVNCWDRTDGTFTDESIGVTYRGEELGHTGRNIRDSISRHASGAIPVLRGRRHRHRRTRASRNA